MLLSKSMITDTDIKKLKTVFATKEDLKGFATKEDLKGFATKEDLKGFATKEDLLRTKFALEDRIEKIEENMATKDDFRKVMTVLDKVLKEVLAMRQEQTIHAEAHIRIDDRLDAVEQTPTVAHELNKQ